MMKTFTRADVLSWRPCYGEIETLRIMEGLPNEMTALDVLRHEAAKPEDRLWCVLRSDVLSDRTLRLFAAWCGRGALDAERTAGREPDVRSWHAVEVAERYAVGRSTEDELRAARAAAYAAVCAAGRRRRRLSVRAAAYAAADCAATDADFAYAATGAYAYAGAYAAYAAARAVYAAVYADARATDAASAIRAAIRAVYAAARAAASEAAYADARAAIRAVYAARAASAARAAQVARLVELIKDVEK